MVKVLKCKSNVYKDLYLLLLLFVIIINYKCTVITVFTRWCFFYLFIYFANLYIDHHLANIARIGNAVVKARGDERDHR